MNIQTILSNRQNYGEKRSIGNIKYIVIHYTGNDGDTAVANGHYFKNNIVKTSSHYFVDDNNIIQSVPDDYIAWAVGGNKYSDCSRTGGGTVYGICTNSNSVSVEMCDTVKNGTFDFTNKTINNAITLIRELMDKYNIDISRVIRHFDVTGKKCPLPYVGADNWNKFKNMSVEKAKMTTEEIQKFNTIVEMAENLKTRIAILETKMIYNYVDKNMPEWARPTIQKLIDNNVLVGNDNGELGLTDEMLRLLVILDRQSVFR